MICLEDFEKIILSLKENGGSMHYSSLYQEVSEYGIDLPKFGALIHTLRMFREIENNDGVITLNQDSVIADYLTTEPIEILR